MLRLSSTRNHLQRALVIQRPSQPFGGIAVHHHQHHHNSRIRFIASVLSKHPSSKSTTTQSTSIPLSYPCSPLGRVGSVRTAVNGVAAKSPKVNGSHHHQTTNGASLTSKAVVETDPQRRKIVKSLLNTLQYAAAMDGSHQLEDDDDDDDEEQWEIQVEVYVDEDNDDDDNEVEGYEYEHDSSKTRDEIASSPAITEDATTVSVPQPLQRPSASSWKRRSPTTTMTLTTPATTTSPATAIATATAIAAAPSNIRAPAAARFKHDSDNWVRHVETQFNYQNKLVQYQAMQARKMKRRQKQHQQQQSQPQQQQSQPPAPFARQQLQQQQQQPQPHSQRQLLVQQQQQLLVQQQQPQQLQQQPHSQRQPQPTDYLQLESQHAPSSLDSPQPQPQQLEQSALSNNLRHPPKDHGNEEDDVVIRSIRSAATHAKWETHQKRQQQQQQQQQQQHRPQYFDQDFFSQHLSNAPPLIEPTTSLGIGGINHEDDEYFMVNLESLELSKREVKPPTPFPTTTASTPRPQFEQEHREAAYTPHQHQQWSPSPYQQQRQEQQHRQPYQPPPLQQQRPPNQPFHQPYPSEQPYQTHPYQPYHQHIIPQEEVPSRRLHSERTRPQYSPKPPTIAAAAAAATANQQVQTHLSASSVFDIGKWSAQGRDDAAKQKDRAIKRLVNAMRLHEMDKAMSIFDDSRSRKMVLPEHVVKDLFFFVVDQQPIFAYQVLKYIRFYHYAATAIPATAETTSTETLTTTSGDETESVTAGTDEQEATVAEPNKPRKLSVELYRRMCKSVRLLDPARVLHRHIRSTIVPLVEDIRRMNLADQKLCLPFLLASLVEQRGVDVGRQAHICYQYMMDHQFDLSERFFEHLLLKSKYTRQDDLPYHDILRQLVKRGGQPAPSLVFHVLQNHFPFTDSEATASILRSILELQRRKQQPAEKTQSQNGEEAQPESTATYDSLDDDIYDMMDVDSRKKTRKPSVQEDYVVDMGMLHHIAAAAAKGGKHDIILLVWDILDMMGIEPTEAIYESTVHSFIKGRYQDINAFSVLAEMEAKGFQPSRGLIRSMSLSLRYSKARVDNAYRIVTEKADGEVSHASLNVIMASCAELDDAEMTFATLNDFAKFNLTPDSDTLSYALEAIGNEMEKEANKSPGRVRHFMAITGAVLNMSEELGISPCHHFIHEYARILCRAGELETARQILLQIVEQPDGGTEKVLGRTVNLVAIENAKAGKYEEARQLIAASQEPTPLALKRIEFLEKGLDDPVKTTRYGFQTGDARGVKVPDEDWGGATSEGGLPHWRIRADPTKKGSDLGKTT